MHETTTKGPRCRGLHECIAAASTFFAGQRWPWRRIEAPLALEVSSIGPEPRWKSYAQAKDGDQVFVYYSLCPQRVPP